MSKKLINILYVEDDENLSMVVSDFLEMQGYHIHLCVDGEEALKVFDTEHFDLCLLDIMLPKMDGYTLAEHIRNINEHIPIFFLSAKSQEEDRIKGFMKGGDDYLTKPFSTEELSLRIQAVLRRVLANQTKKKKASLPKNVKLGELRFNTQNMSISDGNKEVRLTRKENELLKLLLISKNVILKRDEALLEVWGEISHFNSRSMDVYITKLRKILKMDPNVSITNYHGTGFKIEILKD
ncbi:MAG: DNA-binding response regulator [Bacteroidetes bacterium]|nr:MAG: DNA-binding response regulator [Bacteroidota bacterium]